MYQSLAERTGVRLGPAVGTAPTVQEQPVTRIVRDDRRNAPAPRRSLVRTAIALLVQQPGLVHAMEPPYVFGILRQPGIPLLMELIELVRTRPDVATGGILTHFEGRDEQAALNKLSLMDFPAAPEQWRAEFLDALEQLNRQTMQQRVDELRARQAEGAISEVEMRELWDAMSTLKRQPRGSR
jgi:DNA primase